jgi:molybdate transport system ATP-binding protein
MALPAFVVLDNVTFRGPHGPIFAGCTLSIEPGQRWAVVGPSGSGKGLFLAGLMGKLALVQGRLRHPFLEGDPRFADSVFGVLPPGSIALASMKEHSQWLLAREFHQLRWHGSLSQGKATVSDLLDRRHVEQRNPFAVLDEAGDGQFAQARAKQIERFELQPLLQRPVVALSNGELHRFVLARALLRQPRLLLIDDPCAGLDVHSRTRLLAILDELAAEGMGVVLATERESDLPSSTTHIARIEACALQSAGVYVAAAVASGASTETPTFSCARRETRGLAPEIPILDMRDITVRQGPVTLLDGISLRVAQGEHWALLGENGSGKSTLLSLVLADNPQVYVNDVCVAGLRLGPGRSIWDQKAWLGWLSPELETHYPANVRTIEVVLSGFASSLGVYERNTAEQEDAASAWLDELGLEAQADTLFAELAPEARRLALLARAVVHRPSLLLFDEPCQGLDSAGRAVVRSAIAAAVASLSAAMIYVTHDTDEIPSSVSKLLLLHAGRAAYSGPRGSWKK